MKKYLLCLIVLLLQLSSVQAQTEQRYSRKALQQDLAELQRQLYEVHANPFTEFNRQQYDKLFAEMNRQLQDSIALIDFYKLVKPAVAWLSDEHAEISLPASYYTQQVFLPFSLHKEKQIYRIDEIIGSTALPLKKGDTILSINGVALQTILPKLSSYTTGFPEQRNEKSMQLFGYLYALAEKSLSSSYQIGLSNGRQVTVPAITANSWIDHLKKIYGASSGAENRISYTRYGETGYINARSFSTANDEDVRKLDRQIDSIFVQVQNDGVKQLVIDVSKNSGGNSAVGTTLIKYFYKKPYLSYQVNWKRSAEYLNTYTGYGASDARYTALKPGQILHYDSDRISPPQDLPNRFKGKVYVLVGNGTFSSAMMFATTIKDNHIAELIGSTPKNGHPSHFGELYSFKLPNTKLAVRFGVKEWIRPAGQKGVNLLIPDHLLDPGDLGEVLSFAAGASRK